MSMYTVAVAFANAEIDGPADLGSWLEVATTLTPERVDEVTLRLPEFIELQAAVTGAFDAAVRGAALPVPAVERLNEVSERVPRVLRLDGDEASQEPLGASATARTLAEIAWSAIELLGGAGRSPLRRCGACDRYFITTRPDRRWCSNACGNRARVARHHARRRAGVVAP